VQAALDLKLNVVDSPTDLADLTGTVALNQLASWAVVTQGFTATNYTSVSRPSTPARVWWIGDDTTNTTTIPTNSLTNDIIDVRAS
jgi:hypothetical protein